MGDLSGGRDDSCGFRGPLMGLSSGSSELSGVRDLGGFEDDLDEGWCGCELSGGRDPDECWCGVSESIAGGWGWSGG